MSQTIHSIKVKVGSLIAAQKEVGKLRREMQQLNKKDPKFAQKQSALQGQIAATNKKFKSQVNAIKGVQNSTKQLTTSAGRMINTFKSAAVAIASAFAVRAIVGSIKGVIKVMADFEAKMAAVRAISGATDEEFKKLEKSALSLGASTVFTARQVAELQEEYARLGFTTEEIVAATDATLALASATGESLSNSAQTAGSVLRAFGYEATQTQRIAETMAASFTNSALNLERFTESMKFAAPVAASVGFTVEETTTMLMKLADSGLHGSIAGNALKKIFLELGTEGSKLSKKLGGPVQGIEQLDDALIKLQQSGMSAGEATELLGQRASPAFLALLESAGGLGELNDMLSETEGTVSQMAAIRLDTLQGDITLMKSALEGLGLALGDSMNLGLRQLVFRFTEWIRSITNSEEKLNKLKNTLKAVALGIVFLIGRLAAMPFARVAASVFLTAGRFVFFSGRIKMVTASIRGMTAAIAANPVGIFAVALSALGGALLAAKVNNDAFNDSMTESEMKSRRLISALEGQIQAVLDLEEASSERGRLLRQIQAEFGDGILSGLDIELATNEDLIELNTLVKSLGNNLQGVENAKSALDLGEAINQSAIRSIKTFSEDSVEALKSVQFEIGQMTKSLAEENDLTLSKSFFGSIVRGDLFNETEVSRWGEALLQAIAVVKVETQGLDIDPVTFVNENKLKSDKEIIETYVNDLDKIFRGGGGLFENYLGESQGDQNRQLLESTIKPLLKEVEALGGDAADIFFKTFTYKAERSRVGQVLDMTKITKQLEGNIFQTLKKINDRESVLVWDWDNIVKNGEIAVKRLNDYIEKQTKENQKTINDSEISERLKRDEALRMEERKKHLVSLEEFRRFGAEKQKIELETAKETSELLDVALQVSRAGGADSEKGGLLLKELVGTEKDRDRVRKMIKEFGVELFVVSTEYERYVSNLEASLKKETNVLEQIVTVQLQNTKNHFKKLKKLQAKFYADEFKAKMESAKAKHDIEVEAHEKELALMKRNLKDLAKIRGDENTAGASTFAMSEFIKANKTKYQAIKELDAQAYLDAISGEEQHKDNILAIIDNMIQEEQTKEKNNIAYLNQIKRQFQRDEEDLLLERRQTYEKNARDLADIELEMSVGSTIINKKFKEQREQALANKKATDKQIIETHQKTNQRIQEDWADELFAEVDFWDEKIRLAKEGAKAASEAKVTELETQRDDEIADLGPEPDEASDPQAFADYHLKKVELEIKWNNIIEKERLAHIQRLENIEKGNIRSVIDLNKKKNDAIEKVTTEANDAIIDNDNKKNTQLKTNQKNYDDWSLQSTEEQMQGIIDTYAQAFAALSALWDNRIAMERKFLEENFSQRMEDLDRQAEAEIESFEGNSEQQEAIRKKWEKRKELEQEHQDVKLRALEERKFRREKANNIAMALMNGALAVAKVWGETGPFGFALAPIVAALVATQVGLIAAQEFVGQSGGIIPEFGAGGMVNGPSHAKGGVKFGVGGRVVELEGGEAVINKKSTAMFRPQLSAMNVAGGGVKFADGGVIPQSNAVMNKNTSEDFGMLAQRIIDGINDKEVFVTESSVTETQNSISVTESNAVLF